MVCRKIRGKNREKKIYLWVCIKFQMQMRMSKLINKNSMWSFCLQNFAKKFWFVFIFLHHRACWNRKLWWGFGQSNGWGHLYSAWETTTASFKTYIWHFFSFLLRGGVFQIFERLLKVRLGEHPVFSNRQSHLCDVRTYARLSTEGPPQHTC